MSTAASPDGGPHQEYSHITSGPPTVDRPTQQPSPSAPPAPLRERTHMVAPAVQEDLFDDEQDTRQITRSLLQQIMGESPSAELQQTMDLANMGESTQDAWSHMPQARRQPPPPPPRTQPPMQSRPQRCAQLATPAPSTSISARPTREWCEQTSDQAGYASSSFAAPPAHQQRPQAQQHALAPPCMSASPHAQPHDRVL